LDCEIGFLAVNLGVQDSEFVGVYLSLGAGRNASKKNLVHWSLSAHQRFSTTPEVGWRAQFDEQVAWHMQADLII
jgi:hypothetical protein